MDGWWGWIKKLRSKKSSKTIDIVSYASKVSVNGVKCVFVVHCRPSVTFVFDWPVYITHTTQAIYLGTAGTHGHICSPVLFYLPISSFLYKYGKLERRNVFAITQITMYLRKFARCCYYSFSTRIKITKGNYK